MKKIVLLATAAILLLTTAFVSKSDASGIKIGDAIPMASVKMESTKKDQVTLNDIKGENGLLVVFSCNTCPFVLAWEDRYNETFAIAKRNKIGMVLVNSNEAKRSGDDSMAAMIAHAREQGYKMPYVVDANHQLADAFGAKTTPHVFLFNKDGKLAYTGAIDDNGKDKSAVKEAYLAKALAELGAGQLSCKVAETKALGCSIKRVTKN